MTKRSLARRNSVDAGAYTATVFPLSVDEGNGYVASALQLPGCLATGQTEAEALEELRDAIHSWIMTARDFGDEIPPLV
jgi:predicted RNase H-like HicB family nuclease